MELKDIDLLTLCPAFMRKDKSNQILATGVNNVFKTWADDLERLSVVNQIDKLTSAELDQLASDRNIFWYDTNAHISVKRALIKNARVVFNRLGTVWAVESVINDYMPGTELQEWFDYEGEPGYFKIYTTNTGVLKTDIQAFFNILNKIKRKSMWLEAIILELEQQLVVYPAWGIVERSKDTFTFSAYILKSQIHNVMTKSEMQSLTKNKYCEVGSEQD